MASHGYLDISFYLHLLLMLNILHCADPLTCEWESGSGKLIPLIGGGVTQIGVTTLNECKNLCLAQSEYLCHAINYKSNETTCELHVENIQTAYVDSGQTDWRYGIRPRCAGIWLPWTAVNNTYVTENSGARFDPNGVTEGVDKVIDCVKRCTNESNQDYQCRSVTLSRDSKVCQLVNIRSGDDNYVENESTEFQTFNRPHWYLDDSPYSTSAALEAWSATGTAVLIFHNSHQLPVSGYLVGWRYYHSGTKRCNSYAAIWRGSVQDGFRLISKTLLNDTNGGNGNKFQYITDVIRVQKNDVVGVHVELNTNGMGGLPAGCDGNRVSVSIDGSGDQKIIVIVPSELPNKTLPVGVSLINKFSRLHSRHAAINAFIAPFLSVQKAPTVIHTSVNQIQIKWEQLNTTEGLQDYPIIQYRIYCSTDSNFTVGHEVNCLNNTLPNDVTNVSLLNLNLNKPIYTRIQIVRNIYGSEEADEAYSPTSLLFCTGHKRNGLSLNITRASQLTPGSPVSVKLQLLGVQVNDTCLSEFQVSDNSDNLTGFINAHSLGMLNLTQRSLMTFRVKIKLADGYEMNDAVPVMTYTVPSAPAAPESFSVNSLNETCVRLNWNESAGNTEFICSVANSIFNENAGSNGRNITNSTTKNTIDIPGLHPQVQYNCSAKYLIDNGYGESSHVQFWTKPNSGEMVPNYTSDGDAIIDGTTDGQVNITLPSEYPNNPGAVARYMQIAIEMSGSRKKRSTTIIKAEINQSYTESFFIIGDGVLYGGYENRQLAGGSYNIYVGFRAETENEVSGFYVIPGGENLTVEGPPPTTSSPPTGSPSPPTDTGIIAGLVVGFVLLLILVIGIIVFIMKKRRRHANKRDRLEFSFDGEETGDFVNPSLDDEGPPVYPEKETTFTSSPPANQSVSKPSTSNTPSTTNKPKTRSLSKAEGKTRVQDDGLENYENFTAVRKDDLLKHIRTEKDKNPEAPFSLEYSHLQVTKENPNSEGRKPENRQKNRFKNIVAYDQNRVVLPTDDLYDCDYINASFIKDCDGKNLYIASQGPRDTTVVDMWRMIISNEVEIIIMLTNLVEDGKEKCCQYWPASRSSLLEKDLIKVELTREIVYAEYTVRTLNYSQKLAADDNEPAPLGVVEVYHFTAWPDHGVPSTTTGLLNFRYRVKVAMLEKPDNPVIVHCSAGAGRTGTFIGLDILLEIIEQQQNVKQVDIFRCVNEMRRQRPSMLQTVAQYYYLYKLLADILTTGEQTISSDEFQETYSGFKEQGELERQFEILSSIEKIHEPFNYETSKKKENAAKNRTSTILASDDHIPLVLAPEDFVRVHVNAVHVNGYYRQKAYICTQNPLPNTIDDFWSMISFTGSSVLIYFGTERDERPFSSSQGEIFEAGNIKVAHIKTDTEHEDKIQTHHVSLPATEQATKRSLETGEVLVEILEIPLPMGALPSADLLLRLCERMEIHCQTANHTITAICNDGSRVSGLFVTAMNVYLRLKGEQQVNVVLDVKLTRRSRPEFIPTMEEYKLLYDMIENYLEGFANYGNLGN